MLDSALNQMASWAAAFMKVVKGTGNVKLQVSMIVEDALTTCGLLAIGKTVDR